MPDLPVKSRQNKPPFKMNEWHGSFICSSWLRAPSVPFRLALTHNSGSHSINLCWQHYSCIVVP